MVKRDPLDLIHWLFSPPFEWYTEHAAKVQHSAWNPFKWFRSNIKLASLPNIPSSSHINYSYPPFTRHTWRFPCSSSCSECLLLYHPGDTKPSLWTNLYNSTQLIVMVQCLAPLKGCKLDMEPLESPHSVEPVIICWVKWKKSSKTHFIMP